MKVLTFKHGIYPDGHKMATSRKATRTILPGKDSLMVYPMIQHIGEPCEPIVSIGESVLLGQKIGEGNPMTSAPIHASVSGMVKEIGFALSPSGVETNCVTIENDGLFREHNSIKSNDDYISLPREKYIELIREAGIVGLGGAGFPTHIKLSVPDDNKIDYLIVNASECEPYLTGDHRVLLEESQRILIGLQIMLKMFPHAKGIIAIAVNKMDAIKRMKAICKKEKNITIVALKTKYPQGAEKQLIYACTKRTVPSGKTSIPSDVGVIVNNVETIIAVHNAVVKGRPLMKKVITISGGAVNNKGNFKAHIGMSYRELIEQTGGFKEYPHKVISGGPMMGVSIFDIDVPIIKTSSAILCFTKEEAELPEEKNCIRCSKCVQHCPMGLMPLDLNYYVSKGKTDLFEKHSGTDCIECGACSYVCPAKRNLTQSIRSAK